MGSNKVILCFDEDEFFNWFNSLPKDVREHTSMKIKYQENLVKGHKEHFVPVKDIETRM